jgi:hypothetical protein
MGIARVRAGQGWFGRRRHRFCNGNHRSDGYNGCHFGGRLNSRWRG